MRRKLPLAMGIASGVLLLFAIVFGLMFCLIDDFYNNSRGGVEALALEWAVLLLGIMDILAFLSMRKARKERLAFLWVMIQAVLTLLAALLLLPCLVFPFAILFVVLYAGYLWVPATMIAMPVTALGLKKAKFPQWWCLLLWDVLVVLASASPCIFYDFFDLWEIDGMGDMMFMLILIAGLVLRWASSMFLRFAAVRLEKKAALSETAPPQESEQKSENAGQ